MPSRDIDCVEVLCHLGDGGWFEAAIGVARIAGLQAVS